MVKRVCHSQRSHLLLLSLSRVQFFAIPWTVARQAPLSSTISWSLLKLISIDLVVPSNHLMLCCPLFLLPSIFPSIKVFSKEPALHLRWPKCWSFSISSSNEYAWLISFRIKWFDLLAVQGTLESLLQHHNSKAQRSQYIHTCKECLETSKEFKAIGLRDLQEGRVG